MTRRVFSIGSFAGLGSLAGLAVAQTASDAVQRVDTNAISSDLITPDVKRVGVRLRCLCGCAMTVGDCNMVGCHYASPSRQRIRAMLDEGMTDDQIVAVFVKEEGIKVLAAPPATGFNWFGYSAPYLLGGVGAVFLGFVIRRLMRPAAAVETPAAAVVEAPIASSAEMDTYAKRAAREIEELED